MLIGGVDTSFFPSQDPKFAVACYIIMDLGLSVIYKGFESYKLVMDYKSGFLGQRECPAYVNLIKECTIIPDVIYVDGFGVLHPERYGSATRLSSITGIPTIGVAKTLLVNIVNEKIMDIKSSEEEAKLLTARETCGGTYILGAALKIRDKFKNPIFISVGGLITLDESIALTKKLCKYRIPEPIRQADILSREWIRQNTAHFGHQKT